MGALTLGGLALVGADVGGFFKHPDSELVVRWYPDVHTIVDSRPAISEDQTWMAGGPAIPTGRNGVWQGSGTKR